MLLMGGMDVALTTKELLLFDILGVFASSEQPCSGAEGCLRLCIDCARRVWFFAYRLYVSYASVRLEGCLVEILPCFVDGRGILLSRENAVVHSPEQSVSEEGCT